MSNALVHTVIIDTLNMAEMAQFYQEGFGWEVPKPTGPDHVGWQFSNLYFGFDLVTKERERTEYPGAVSLWFAVDDLQATFDQLVALGARERYAPTLKEWGAWLAAVYDPDGNIIGLTQRT